MAQKQISQDFLIDDENLSDVDSSLDRYKSRNLKRSSMERSSKNIFLKPKQHFQDLTTDPDVERTSKKEHYQKPQMVVQDCEEGITKLDHDRVQSPKSIATDGVHPIFTQMVLEGDRKFEQHLTEFQISNDQKNMTADDFPLEDLTKIQERQGDQIQTSEGIQNANSYMIDHADQFQMQDTKVIVKTETKLGSSGTVQSSNFKFGMSGPVLEESLKLNPQADQGIPIYVKKRRQNANVQDLQEYDIIEESQYQPMGEDDGSVYYIKRPSTIQEASNANMEETEGNEPSLVYNSIRNSQDAYPLGLYSYSQMSKPGTKMPSGSRTPYAHGNQILMTIQNDRRSQPSLQNKQTLNSNIQSQRTLGGNDHILIQSSNHFRSLQDLNQYEHVSNKNVRHSKSSGNSSTQHGGLVESKIHQNSSLSNLIDSPLSPVLKVFCVVNNPNKPYLQTKNDESQFFTTAEPCSFLLKQQVFGPQDKFICQNLIETLLQRPKDLETFVIGASTESKHQPDQLNLQMFEFDSCFQSSEYLNQLTATKTKNSFIILFGSQSTQKSQQLSEIIENTYQNMTNKTVKSLKVFLCFQDQEIVIKDIPHKVNSENIKMHILNAMEQKERIISENENSNQEIGHIMRNASSFVVQLGSSFFIDLANIDGLNSECNTQLMKCLNDDFGTITNGILMASPFYQDHQFLINPEQQRSSLFKLVDLHMKKSSEITFISFVESSPKTAEDEVNSSITVDFSHKIRSFFNGKADSCHIQSLLQNSSPETVKKIKDDYYKVMLVFTKVKSIGQKVAKEAAKFQKSHIKYDQGFLERALVQIQKYDVLLEELLQFICNKVVKDIKQTFHQEQIQRIQNSISIAITKIQENIRSTSKFIKNNKSPKYQNTNDRNYHKTQTGQFIFSTFGGEDKSNHSVKKSIRGGSLPRYKSTHDLDLENKFYKIDQNYLECLQSPLLSQSRSRSVNEGFITRKNANYRSQRQAQIQNKSKKRLRKLRAPQNDNFVSRETKSTLLKQTMPFKTLQNLGKENPTGHRELMFHNDQSFVQEERRLTLEKKSEPKIMRRAKSSKTKLVRMRVQNMLAEKQQNLVKRFRKKSVKPKKRHSSFFNACSPAISADSHLFKSLTALNDQDQDDVQNYLYKSSEQISENQQFFTMNQNNKLQDSYMRQSERSLLSASQTYQKYQVKENQDLQTTQNKCSLKFNIKRGRNGQNYSTSSQKLIHKTFENLIDKRKNSQGLNPKTSQDFLGNYNQVIKPNLWKQNLINPKSSRTNRSLADFVELENQLLQKDKEIKQLQSGDKILEQLMAENKFLKEKLEQKQNNDNLLKDQKIQMLQVQIRALNKKCQNLQVKNGEFKSEKHSQIQNSKDIKFLRCQLQMALIQISQKEEANKKLQMEVAEAKKQIKVVQQKLQFTFDIREKSNQRQDRIGSLKEENSDLRKEMSSKDKLLTQQKGRVQTLTKQISFLQLQLADSLKDLSQKSKKQVKSLDQTQNKSLVQKITQLKDVVIDLESQMDVKDSQIEVLEMARDKFREQALDLKYEVKRLKSKKGHLSLGKSRNGSGVGESYTDENSTGCPISKFDELKMKQSMLRKDEVLRDIKSLMHDYKQNNTIKLPSKECLLNSYKTHGHYREAGASTENLIVSQQHKRLGVFDSNNYLIDQDL